MTDRMAASIRDQLVDISNQLRFRNQVELIKLNCDLGLITTKEAMKAVAELIGNAEEIDSRNHIFAD